MTRKCAMCKETNYRNSYSFFSAPKDRETRQKWQEAIAIENYAVTDDTYVCSKHFHRDDIITHWASGVPPYVITIKYKKCRLRPGAVPGRNYHEENEDTSHEHSDNSDESYSPFNLRKTDAVEDKGKDVMPRTEEKLEINCYEKQKIIPLHYKYSREFHDHNYMPNAKSETMVENLEDNINVDNRSHDESTEKNFQQVKGSKTKSETMVENLEDNINVDNRSHDESTEKNFQQVKGSKTVNLSNDTETFDDVCSVKEETNSTNEEVSFHQDEISTNLGETESSSKVPEPIEETDMLVQFWEHKVMKDELIDNSYNKNKNLSQQNQNSSNYTQLDANCITNNADSEENEMLFEDLLEICTEVVLPRGWSCLVTSTGHTTTIVYMYMAMTKNGMPFTEKQVFIKSDMRLHCVAVNREINLLTHNLIREGKHLRVQNLSDIEELVEEFDQRMICQGICNVDGLQEVTIKVVYKDGVKWRHILCPLIMNSGSLRCTRCITLSHRLQRGSKTRHPLSYNLSIFTRNKQRVHTLRHKHKRTRKQARKHEFIKVSKK